MDLAVNENTDDIGVLERALMADIAAAADEQAIEARARRRARQEGLGLRAAEDAGRDERRRSARRWARRSTA